MAGRGDRSSLLPWRCNDRGLAPSDRGLKPRVSRGPRPCRSESFHAPRLPGHGPEPLEGFGALMKSNSSSPSGAFVPTVLRFAERIAREVAAPRILVGYS